MAVPISSAPRVPHATRLGGIGAESRASLVLTTLERLDEVRTHLDANESTKGVRVVATDTVPRSLSTEWNEPSLGGDAPALLQYRTRPNRAPEGILVSHGNLLHVSEAVKRAFRLSARTVSVSWMPVTHDMGLIDGLLQPLYAGFSTVLLPPETFLRTPARWLDAVTRYRATHSGGPDFAYDYCVRRTLPSDRAAFDLSSWVSAYNGSRSSRRDAIQRFSTAFAPSGFHPSLVHPCCGRALAIPSVSTGPAREERAAELERRHAPRVTPAIQPIRLAARRAAASTARSSRPRPVESGLRAEAVLGDDFRIETASAPCASEARSLFLTGATGFLGAFLLKDLLDHTDAEVHCLVRASGTGEGMRRIERHLRGFGLWCKRDASRIVPVPGDLMKPMLGLSPSEYESLAARIDAVYHGAGVVHWVYPYPALRGANVQGTRVTLAFAASTKIKPFHHVSSLSVFESAAYSGRRITEADSPVHCEGIYGGWSQSKWVAEQLVAEARDRGLPTCIYRLPLISGHSRTGLWDQRDFYGRMIKGCIQLGAFPSLDTILDIAPVDYVSRAIGVLSRRPDAPGKVFHLNNPRPLHWTGLCDWLKRFGYRVEAQPYREWVRHLGDEGRSNGNPLYPLMSLFVRRWTNEELTIPELRQRGWSARIDCRATLEMLPQSAPACPPIDDDLLRTYFNRFIESGFLEPPSPSL